MTTPDAGRADTAAADSTADTATDTTPAAAPVVSAPVVSGTVDSRTGGPRLGTEREVLDGWLDDYRLNVLLKIDGLTADQLAERPLPPSTLSLLGIVRHLTEVEVYWLREVLHGEDLPDCYSTRESPDGDFDLGTPASAADDVTRYRAEVEQCRAGAAGWTDLDGPVAGLRHGQQVSLRWILTHLIEEYARHLGHMDLLRERIDGVAGY